MRRKRKFWFLFLMFVFLLIGIVQASILQTKNSKGITTDKFLTSDEVYLKSNTGLCNNLYESVDVYVIESGGTILVDVRGGFQEVNLTTNYQIPSNTKIWSAPEVGDYDVIVDCDKSGAYHPLEPKTSFSVQFKKGSASAEIGKNDIGNHTWQYDPEQPDLINEMLQLSLLAGGEDVELENITIEALGKGNDTKINALEVYIDGNHNGKLDEEEIVIGDSQPAYNQDDGITVISLDYTLTAGVVDDILIVYTMAENISKGDFSLKVNSIYGLGAQSNEEIRFSGTPLSSGFKTVLPEKTCLGTLTLELNPNPADENVSVNAKMSGLTGCDNKTIYLRRNPCTFPLVEEIQSCDVVGEGCEISVSSPETRRYYACIDKNEDGDRVDFGESVFQDLAVNIKEVEEEVNVTEEMNVTVEKNITGEEPVPGVTGEVIGTLGEKFVGKIN